MRPDSTKGAQGAPSSFRRDLYQEVTDKIVAALEKGVAPWVRPWRKLGAAGDLRNAATNRPYSGVNIMLLSLATDAAGYDDPRWLTFRQARQLGGCVRKGEKATLVVFWKPIEVPGDNPTDTGGQQRTKTVPVLRHYTVFNVRQCDGLSSSVSLGGFAHARNRSCQSVDMAPECSRHRRMHTAWSALPGAICRIGRRCCLEAWVVRGQDWGHVRTW